MMRRITSIIIFIGILCSSINPEARLLSFGGGVAPLILVITPSPASISCTLAGGSVVSTASVIGGNGNPVTFSMTGNTTDYTINSATGVVTVVPGGITSTNCGQTFSNTITATQS